MEVMAKLTHQSPKPIHMVRTIINAKLKTLTIPKSKFGAPTFSLAQNNSAGNFLLYESLMDTSIKEKALAPGKQVHAHILLTGLQQNPFLRSKLLSMYIICDSLEDARQLFDKMPQPNTDAFSWNAMIRAYASNGLCEEAIRMYYQMHGKDVSPNNFTFPFVLKACSGISALSEGMQIHVCVIKRGFECDVYAGNAIIAMYAKCGRKEDARRVFDKMSQRDVVSWNSIIAGYVHNCCCNEALELFDRMEEGGVKPDVVSAVSILSVCADLEDLEQGRKLHDYISRSGFDSDVSAGNALIDMYAKCGVVEMARQVFDKMSERNVVSWNSMIAGYAQADCGEEALEQFRYMQQAGMRPDAISIASVLSVSAQLGVLQQGKEIHNYAIKNGLPSNNFVANSLIDMYFKCGSVEIAHRVFLELDEKNAVSWSAMIAGYAQNMHDNEAVSLFRQMQLVGPKMI